MAQPIRGKRGKAIKALLTGASVPDAATIAGVDRTTVWRWLTQDDDFAQAIADAAGGAIETAARRLSIASDSAVTVLAAIADDETAAPSARIRAADLVLTHAIKYAELLDVMRRLADLEQRYDEIDARAYR